LQLKAPVETRSQESHSQTGTDEEGQEEETQDSDDDGGAERETQQQTSTDPQPSTSKEPQPSTSREPHPSTSQGPQKPVAAAGRASSKRKAKASKEEDTSLTAIGQYFTQKTASGKEAAVHNDDDTAFGTVIAWELRKISSAAVKRHVKKQLLDVVLSGQEADEQVQQQNVQLVQLVVSSEGGQQQTTTISPEDAQLLLNMQLQQQPQQQ